VKLVCPVNGMDDWTVVPEDDPIMVILLTPIQDVAPEHLQWRSKCRLDGDRIWNGEKQYVPVNLQRELVKETHKLCHSGRYGVAQLLGQFWWPNKADSIDGEVKYCEACQMTSTYKNRTYGLPHSLVRGGKPLTDWAIDFVEINPEEFIFTAVCIVSGKV
jgi:hypothetical protein